MVNSNVFLFYSMKHLIIDINSLVWNPSKPKSYLTLFYSTSCKVKKQVKKILGSTIEHSTWNNNQINDNSLQIETQTSLVSKL